MHRFNPGLVSQLSNAAQHSQAEASPIAASGLVRSTLRLAWHASVAAQIMVDLLTEDDRSGSRSAEHSWLKRQSVLEAICLASGIRVTADSWRIMIPRPCPPPGEERSGNSSPPREQWQGCAAGARVELLARERGGLDSR